MVAYQEVTIKELRLKLVPIGIRKFLDRYHIPIPYFHFQKPKWKLYVKRLSTKEEQPRKLKWFLKLADNRTTMGEIDLPKMKVGQENIYEVGHRLISPIGSTAFCITIPEWGNQHHTLCEFYAISEEQYFIPFATAFIAGILAGWIVSLLI